MASEQTRITREGQEQEQSLLLGILMQRQNQPMSKQLEVANDPEFAKLPSVVAVVAAKDMKTPLSRQGLLATYMGLGCFGRGVRLESESSCRGGSDGRGF